MKNLHKKSLSAGLAVAMLVTGTLAWQSFNQTATNKVSGPGLVEEPGGRLHDDFDGKNKDVYVENYADEEDGVNVFARIRLDEYFEYGDYVDTDPVNSSNVTIIRGDKQNLSTPDRNDVTSWDTYLYQSTANGFEANSGNENIRTYRDLAFGGSTAYLPTFNKNVWNKDADINGTYESLTVNADLSITRYTDYDNYVFGMPAVSGTATYAVDSTDESNTGTTTDVEAHDIQNTAIASIMTMSDWVTAGKPIGDYWVYDIDGWAYYAKGIEPETASGLLLDEIEVILDPNAEWYYGIHVVAQMATAGDWGVEGSSNPDELGMYADGITPDGIILLNTIAANTAVTSINIVNIDQSVLTLSDLSVNQGTNLELGVLINVYNSAGSATETAVEWTISRESTVSSVTDIQIEAALDSNGVFSPTFDMIGDQYRIKVTSLFDSTKSNEIIVTVTN